MLGIIKRNFIHISSSTFILLYKSIIRPHLYYANSVWHTCKVGDIEDIEKVQKRATKLVITLKKLRYKDRLEHLHLITLKYRRLTGDMIEVYKIVINKHETTVSPVLEFHTNTITRGNKYKWLNTSFHYDVRKYSFTPRIVNTWNSLPDYVVKYVNVDSVEVFINV